MSHQAWHDESSSSNQEIVMETSDRIELKQRAPEAPKVIELGHVSEETKGGLGQHTEGNPAMPFILSA
jgi:hypothetical protein